jgi:hypothetical protein
MLVPVSAHGSPVIEIAPQSPRCSTTPNQVIGAAREAVDATILQ